MKTTAEQRKDWRPRGTSIFHTQEVIDDLEELIGAVTKHRGDMTMTHIGSRYTHEQIDIALWSILDEPKPATVEERLAAVENKVKALEEK